MEIKYLTDKLRILKLINKILSDLHLLKIVYKKIGNISRKYLKNFLNLNIFKKIKLILINFFKLIFTFAVHLNSFIK